MRIRVLSLLLSVAAFLVNAVHAANIAHGVEVVVIDAGHGGKFPGAHYGGVYEKDLTLKVALKVGRLIEQGLPGVKVVYTRKTDTELGPTLADDLQARADIANKAGGDLFISIHVNAARATAARGVETLIMGESSKEQRYNENALYESNREDLIDMSDERTAAIVRAYIQNLQFTYGEYSMAMARFVQNNYIGRGRHSRGVKPQLLRVLYATDMPGVLTEIGFMTNPQEMAYMKSEKGQNEIARDIYQAVRDYSAYVLRIRKSEGDSAAKPDSAKSESGSGSAAKPAPQATPAGETKNAAGKGTKSVAGARPEGASGGRSDAAETGRSAKGAAKESGAGRTAVAETGSSSSGGVRYAVQVMASAKELPLSSSQFRSYRGRVKQYEAEGRFPYKYCVGEYADHNKALQRMREVRAVFPDAFVVRVRGGRIVK